MVGAADPSGILQNPWKEVLEKQHPEVSVLAWRHQGMMGSPGGLCWDQVWKGRGAGGRPGKGGEEFGANCGKLLFFCLLRRGGQRSRKVYFVDLKLE